MRQMEIKDRHLRRVAARVAAKVNLAFFEETIPEQDYLLRENVSPTAVAALADEVIAGRFGADLRMPKEVRGKDFLRWDQDGMRIAIPAYL